VKFFILRSIVNTGLVLFFLGILIAPPAFSSFILLRPLEEKELVSPSFTVSRGESEELSSLSFGTAFRKTVWAIPVTYTLQFSRKGRVRKALSVMNTSTKPVLFRLVLPENGEIVPVFSYAIQGSKGQEIKDEQEVLLDPKMSAYIDFLIETESGQEGTVEATIQMIASFSD